MRLEARCHVIATEVARRRVNDVGIDLVRAECASHRFRPHLHADVALGVVASGRHRLRCASGSHIVGAGDIVMINAGEVHTGESLDGLPWSYSMFYIPVRLLHSLVPAPAGGGSAALWFPTALIRDPPLARQLTSLHEELRAHVHPEPRYRLAAALRQVTLRNAVPLIPPAQPPDARPHERARAYLEHHYARPIRLIDLSRVAGVSIFHLIRAFKQAVGMPPGAYLRQVRIAHAQTMLRSGRPVAEVARATAFSDQSHFTRRFKETLGYPPGAYLRAVLSRAAGWVGTPRDPTR
jgi:AraC-like DNA-binding protein